MPVQLPGYIRLQNDKKAQYYPMKDFYQDLS